MTNKYKTPENEPMFAQEPATAYRTRQMPTVEVASADRWNPNVPFHGTQEEWWEHFRGIEAGEFYPISETHQRVLQWLDRQKR
ncbi:MAG: hypothetical protein FWF09_04275 [Bacteroidales bacterium]|nr:hypothetical protein [Bacteroidales bacterium]